MFNNMYTSCMINNISKLSFVYFMYIIHSALRWRGDILKQKQLKGAIIIFISKGDQYDVG